jgi:glycosyltransferase involved in cell wall biosynthesis
MNVNSGKSPLRILCISPLFAPRAAAEAFCGTKMVQALEKSGAVVTVLSNTSIWPGFPIDDSRLWGRRGEIIDVPTPSQPNLFNSVVMALRYQTPFYSRWIGNVVSVAKSLHRATPFDLIYSRGTPSVAHMAGFWCAKKLGIPWIANINDPWIFEFLLDRAHTIGYTAPATAHSIPKLSPLETRTHLFWMRRTLKNADLITYPCKRLHDFHISLAELDHAAEIIPHVGYRPTESISELNGHFRIVHAGALGVSEATGRSAKPLLLGLKAFTETSPEAAAQTKLVLVGTEDKETQAFVSELGLESNVETVGRVNYETSVKHIFSASVCLLIEANMDDGIFFPSKLADYLVCGKPVLALSPRSGTVADLASRDELIRVDHDPGAIKNAIAALYTEYKRGTLSSRSPSDKLQAEFEGRSVAEKFLSVCQIHTAKQHEGLRA